MPSGMPPSPLTQGKLAGGRNGSSLSRTGLSASCRRGERPRRPSPRERGCLWRAASPPLSSLKPKLRRQDGVQVQVEATGGSSSPPSPASSIRILCGRRADSRPGYFSEYSVGREAWRLREKTSPTSSRHRARQPGPLTKRATVAFLSSLPRAALPLLFLLLTLLPWSSDRAFPCCAPSPS